VTRIVIVLSVLILLPAYGAAQQVPDGPLTLQGAVDLALRNHPAIREARAGASAASDEVAVAQTAYLPRADLLWQVNRATRNNVFGLLLPQPVIPAVSGPVLNTDTLNGVWSSAGGLLLSWEAIDFGRRRASVDLARAESGSADARRRVTELDIASHAADAFLGVVAAQASLEAAQANVQRLEIFSNTVRALVENQLRAGAEQSRAEAELAVARNRVIEAERNLELARVALADALGVPGVPIAVDQRSIMRLPPRPGPSAFDPAAHPRTVAADAEVTAVRARDRVLDASYFPRVELQSAFSGRGVSQQIDGTTSNGNALGWQVPNWAFGMSVTFPSLEIFRTRARRQVEANRLQQATAQYDLTVQALQTQEARARAITAAAFQIAANTPQQLQAARDTDVQARARYDAGLTSVLEVAEAQRLLAQAEADDAVATLAVWRAMLAQTLVRGDVQPFLDLIRVTPAAPIQ
jgi:outer membrane protein